MSARYKLSKRIYVVGVAVLLYLHLSGTTSTPPNPDTTNNRSTVGQTASYNSMSTDTDSSFSSTTTSRDTSFSSTTTSPDTSFSSTTTSPDTSISSTTSPDTSVSSATTSPDTSFSSTTKSPDSSVSSSTSLDTSFSSTTTSLDTSFSITTTSPDTSFSSTTTGPDTSVNSSTSPDASVSSTTTSPDTSFSSTTTSPDTSVSSLTSPDTSFSSTTTSLDTSFSSTTTSPDTSFSSITTSHDTSVISSTSPDTSVSSTTTSPHSSFSRTTTSPDTSFSSTTTSQDTSVSSSTSPDTSFSSTTTSLDTLFSSTTTSPDTSVSSTTTSPDTSISSTTTSPDTSFSSTTTSPDTTVSSTTTRPDTSFSSTTTSPDTSFSSTTKSPDSSVSSSTSPDTSFSSTTTSLDTSFSSTTTSPDTLFSSTTTSPDTSVNSSTSPDASVSSTTTSPDTSFSSTTTSPDTSVSSSTSPDTSFSSTTTSLDTSFSSTTTSPDTSFSSITTSPDTSVISSTSPDTSVSSTTTSPHSSFSRTTTSPDTSFSSTTTSQDTSISSSTSPDTSFSSTTTSLDTLFSSSTTSPDTSVSSTTTSPDTSISNTTTSPDTSFSSMTTSPDTTVSSTTTRPDTSFSSTTTSPYTSVSNSTSPDTSFSSTTTSPDASFSSTTTSPDTWVSSTTSPDTSFNSTASPDTSANSTITSPNTSSDTSVSSTTTSPDTSLGSTTSLDTSFNSTTSPDTSSNSTITSPNTSFSSTTSSDASVSSTTTIPDNPFNSTTTSPDTSLSSTTSSDTSVSSTTISHDTSLSSRTTHTYTSNPMTTTTPYTPFSSTPADQFSSSSTTSATTTSATITRVFVIEEFVNASSDDCATTGKRFQFLLSTNFKMYYHIYRTEWIRSDALQEVHFSIGPDYCDVVAIINSTIDLLKFSGNCNSTNDSYILDMNQVTGDDIGHSWTVSTQLQRTSHSILVRRCGSDDQLNTTSQECATLGKRFRLRATYDFNKHNVDINEILWRNHVSSGFVHFDIHNNCSISLTGHYDRTKYSFYCNSTENAYFVEINNVTNIDLDVNWTVTTQFDVVSDPITVTLCGCGNPSDIENGDVNYNDTITNSTAIYTCEVGHNLVGTSAITCGPTGTWVGDIPKCQLVDCGLPQGIKDGQYTLVGSTTYSSIALYTCYAGFKLNDTNNRKRCEAAGIWTGDIGTCVRLECRSLSTPTDGVIAYSDDNKTATFSCNSGFRLIGRNKLFCESTGYWSETVPKCEKVEAEIKYCQRDEDSRGTMWNETSPGQIVTSQCPRGQEGTISRQCNQTGYWKLPRYTCVKKEISEAESKIDVIESSNITEAVKVGIVSDVLDTLSNSTTETVSSVNAGMGDGEIEKVTSILERVASISQNIVVTDKQSENFIGTTSNLLNQQNSGSFRSLEENKEQNDTSPVGADKVLEVVGNFARAIGNSLDKLNGSKTIQTDNMVVTVSKFDEDEDIQFPLRTSPSSYINSSTSADIPHFGLIGVGSYSGIFYSNLSGLLSPRVHEKGSDYESHFEMNAAVIDMQLLNSTGTPPNFKINLNFDNFQSGNHELKCCFWNFTRRSWDTFGCELDRVKTNTSITVCTCNHTTNFAILMNPSKTQNVETKILDYISLVGCSISMVCLIVTIVMHASLWRYLKSDRAIILINLSIALILSYATFVFGVDKTEHKVVCKTVAIALHYIYLVVFFLMLSEGIEILITVVYVFVMKSRLRRLLLMSWGLPAIIVGTSVAVTQTDGYGSEDYCWLSVHSGLIWAFAGPALAIILGNFVQLCIVIKAMFKVRTLKERSRIEKVKTGVRCLCVLLPLTGGTWVIGVFYVDETLDWIQYTFAVLNGLQGVFIMLFHCVTNSQIKIAISRRMKLYRASTAYSRSSNNPTPRTSAQTELYSNRHERSTKPYNGSRDLIDDSFQSFDRHLNQWVEKADTERLKGTHD